MLDCVLQGRVYKAARECLLDGERAAVAIVRACVRDRQPMLIEVCATSATTREVLTKLTRGDEVAIVGALMPSIQYHEERPRLRLEVRAHRVIAGKRLERASRNDEGGEPIFVYIAGDQAELSDTLGPDLN